MFSLYKIRDKCRFLIAAMADNRLELGLYDSFAPEASFFGPALTTTFFTNLVRDRIVPGGWN